MGRRYRGYAEVRHFFAKLVEHIDSLMDIGRLIDAGEHVEALGYSRGHVTANDNESEVPVAHVWTMQNGDVLSVPYNDRALSRAEQRSHTTSRFGSRSAGSEPPAVNQDSCSASAPTPG